MNRIPAFAVMLALTAGVGGVHAAPPQGPLAPAPDMMKPTRNLSGAKWRWVPIETWEKHPDGESFGGAARSRQAGIVVTSRGRIFVSPDGGTTWGPAETGLPPSEDESKPGFYCWLAAGETLLAGGYRRIVVSRDRGVTWEQAEISELPRTGPSSRKWEVRAISADPENPRFMMALAYLPKFQSRGTPSVTVRPDVAIVIKSSDGGRTWTEEMSPGGLDLGRVFALRYVRHGQTMAVGQDSDRSRYSEEQTQDPMRDVWVSTDDGRTWFPAGGPSQFLTSLRHARSAWIESVQGTVYMARRVERTPMWRSVDGGEWHEVPHPGRMVISMALFSPSIAVARVSLRPGDPDVLFHTMNADDASPRWVEDAIPDDAAIGRVLATPGGRYPFVVMGSLGSRLAIFRPLTPPSDQIRSPEMRPPDTRRLRGIGQ